VPLIHTVRGVGYMLTDKAPWRREGCATRARLENDCGDSRQAIL